MDCLVKFASFILKFSDAFYIIGRFPFTSRCLLPEERALMEPSFDLTSLILGKYKMDFFSLPMHPECWPELLDSSATSELSQIFSTLILIDWQCPCI